MPPRFITVTLNPALDIAVQIEPLTAGKRIAAKKVALYPGGKGINVAKALASLGRTCHCLGFVGESAALPWTSLVGDTFSLDLLPVKGQTRCNLTLIEDGSEVRHIVSTGFTLADNDFYRLHERIALSVRPADWLIFSGSLPPGGA